MIIANTSKGTTHQFDLTDDAQHRALTDLVYAGQVTALSILHRGVQHALPLPKRFGKHGRPTFGAELLRNGVRLADGSQAPVGERIFCQVGEIRVSVTATFTGALVRCDVVKIGRQQYDPRNRA